jgi:hypothetical protein
MGYREIDPVLMPWALGKGVHVLMHHRDTEVRGIMIYDPSGQRRNMWIDPLDEKGRIGLHAAMFDGWKIDRTVTAAELRNALDEVYDAMASRADPTSNSLR